MDHELGVETKLVKGNATWEGYLFRFYALERIAAFRASNNLTACPFYSPKAIWS
jgi:hypothetical protein